MLRKMLLLLVLALSTASVGCLDDDPEETPKKSAEDDPDFVPPNPEEEPDDCGPSLQDSEDESCAPPRP